MNEPRDLAQAERRAASVMAVRQVMQAVWALARAQLPRAEKAAAEATIYLDWASAAVERLAGEALPSSEHETLWVVVGPERPLCGGLGRQILDQVPPAGRLGLVGQRLIEQASLARDVQQRVVFGVGGAAGSDEVSAAAERIADAILAERDEARVVLLHPVGGTSHLHRVVLLARGRGPREAPPETLSPYLDVLEAAVVEAVRGRLGVAVAEAMRTEARARMAAAEAARAACDDQLEELEHAWRSLRQDAITQELLEIVGARKARERQHEV